ncbi:uncharacterized protein VTP21DRAFT_7098 [Calcarisporiella thermophila]|uniref:uncharacterized protein n=1 Tax=Calcarisporiella thermophila TaxID=911321 RepID=UPI0037432D83
MKDSHRIVLEATLKIDNEKHAVARVGLKLWNALHNHREEGGEYDVLIPSYISIALIPKDSYPRSTQPYNHIVFAELSQEIGADSEDIRISEDLLGSHFHLTEETRLNIQRVQIIDLKEVILGAINTQTYEIFRKDPDRIWSYFRESSPPVILRYSQTYALRLQNYPDEDIKLRVLMCDPVLQGRVTTETKFIVTIVDDERSPSVHADKQLNNEELNGMEELDGESTEQEFELDSSFMMPKLVSPFSNHNDKSIDGLHFPVSISDDEDEEKLDSNQNMATNNRANYESQEQTLSFIPTLLSENISSRTLIPAPDEKDDSEARVLVDVGDLGRLKVFSGDWVLVSGPNFKKSRLCRIYGWTNPLADNKKNSPQPLAHITPLLYFNLGFPLPPLSSKDAVLRISQAHALGPPPTAKAVTVARVTSPTSVDKAITNSFFDALRRWFEREERIVVEGDVFGIVVDEKSARLRLPKKDQEGEILQWDEHKVQNASENPTIVYYKITSVESDYNEHHSKLGYGRKVDPNHTKMVQTGMEHSRVPIGFSRMYGAGCGLPSSSQLQSSSTPSAYVALYDLISSCLHPMSIDLELTCTVLLHGPRGSGKRTIVEWIVEQLGVHVYEVNCYEFAGESEMKTEGNLRVRFDKAVQFSPCVFLLRHVDALARKSAVVETGQEPVIATVLQDLFGQLTTKFRETGYPLMVVGTTTDIDKLPANVLGCFRHEIALEAPTEPQRLAILQTLLTQSPLAPDVSLSSLATQTAALVAKDLVDLVARAGLAALDRVTHSTKNVRDEDISSAGVVLTAADFDLALGKARSSYSDSIGAPKIPNVTWDDVGGLASVKDDILDTIQLPLEHPELFASGIKKRSGILLYGPPGTGKTLLAKAVATSCSLNFFSVKGPELLNMYIGESEANVRRVFQRARDAKPCVIFFDELDSVAPKRGEKGDSGGVMDRIVSQLLAELDGMGEGGGAADVFVIGATNRPDLLDPALLRPGRFDKLLYLGVCEDHESQLKIIQALTRKFRLHPDLDLTHIAERCPFHYTGADFYALCSDAMLKAMARTAEALESKVSAINSNPSSTHPTPITAQYFLDHLATPADIEVEVCEEDFDKALRELIPSVSEKELEHYKKVRERFEGTSSAEGDEETEKEQVLKKLNALAGSGKGKEKVVESGGGSGVGSGSGNGNGRPRRPEIMEGKGKARTGDVDPVKGKGRDKGKGKARA